MLEDKITYVHEHPEVTSRRRQEKAAIFAQYVKTAPARTGQESSSSRVSPSDTNASNAEQVEM